MTEIISPSKFVTNQLCSSSFYLAKTPEHHHDLEILQLIGKSRFPIYLTYSRNYHAYYAMKVFPYKHSAISNSYLSELRFSFLSHPNILSVTEARSFQIGIKKSKKYACSYLLLELAPYGDIAKHIRNSSFPLDDEKLVRTYFHQLIAGLEYLHSKGMAHMDLKLDNLLLGENFTLKIADFDFCISGSESYVSGHGSPNFRAPEVKTGQSRNPKSSDIFAAGICLFALKVQSLPFREDKPVSGFDLYTILLDEPEKFWSAWESFGEKFDKSFKVLFESMTRRDPEKRITIEEVKASVWYNGPIYSQKMVKNILKDKISPVFSFEYSK